MGKVSAQECYEAIAKITPHDNESTVRNIAPFYMSMAELLDGLGLVQNADAVPLTVEKDGTQTTVVLHPEEGDFRPNQFVIPDTWVDARDPAAPLPLWQKDPANFYWFEYLQDSRTL